MPFIRELSLEWPGFASAAISSKDGAELVSYILKFVDAEYVCEKMNTENLLTTYLSEQGHFVLTSDFKLPEDYNVLKSLDVLFHDLASLEINKSALEFAHEQRLYTINTKNVDYILREFSVSPSINTISPKTANYTSILAAGSNSLQGYIEENITDYIENVFLPLPDNSEESESAIKALINNDRIEGGLKKKVISKQNHVFETFDEIPEFLCSHLMLEEKIIISWENISEYLNQEDNDEAVITTLLGRQYFVDSLSRVNISKKTSARTIVQHYPCLFLLIMR